MKKSFIIVYSVIVSLVLIFAITFFGVNIYNENQHGELRTQVRFEKMAAGVFTAAQKNNISQTELLRQIENAIGDTNDFSYIQINIDGKNIYSYPLDLQTEQTSQSKLIINYNKTSATVKGEIKAGLYTLRPGSIFYYAKISFFIILIIALITVILIIYANQFDKSNSLNLKSRRKMISFENSQENNEGSENETQDKAETTEEIKVDETKENEIPSEIKKEEKLDEPVKNQEKPEEPEKIPGKTEESENTNNIEKAEKSESTVDSKEETKSKEAELPTQDFEPVHMEKGLFSPDTGLGWESYLMTRLDNELNRATASELDLGLFVIQINGISRKNPLMKKICDYLIVEFQFKDLLFEYKDDCICGLKISMNIDNAVTFGEKLATDIKDILKEEGSDIFIGITSRGIRMVSGERLLKEADEALIHAKEDKNCPVVGFRADAVKYRKFLETN